MYRNCLVCGSHKIIPNLPLRDAEYYPSQSHKVTVESKPTAILFRGSVSGQVLGYVCGNCGYIAFFAEYHEELYDAYKQASQNNEQ